MDKEEIIKYLKKRLKHAKERSLGLGFTMDDNLTKYSGWDIGYWCACVSTIENTLDAIYGNDSWECDDDH